MGDDARTRKAEAAARFNRMSVTRIRGTKEGGGRRAVIRPDITSEHYHRSAWRIAMATTADQRIAQSQMQGDEQYRELLSYVTGAASRTASAYDVEVRIFRGVLALGGTLLRLFFESRAAERPAGPVTGVDGTALAYRDRRPVTYRSVFGKLVFWRHAFAAPGQPMVCPLDAELSWPERCYSDLLREWSGFGSADASFREMAASLARILGFRLSIQALETTVREDAVDVPAFYERPVEAATPPEAASILVAQADGKGVPMVQPPTERPARRGKGHPSNRLREAVVTALYTIQPYQRTPEAVAAALLRDPDRPPPGPRPRPVNKELRATLDGKAVGVTRLAARAERRDGPQIRDRVALTDGAVALQDQMRAALPGYTLVLDIIHAVEYLWDAANAILGERHPERTAWVRGHLLALLRGQTDEVITASTAPRPPFRYPQKLMLWPTMQRPDHLAACSTDSGHTPIEWRLTSIRKAGSPTSGSASWMSSVSSPVSASSTWRLVGVPSSFRPLSVSGRRATPWASI